MVVPILGLYKKVFSIRIGMAEKDMNEVFVPILPEIRVKNELVSIQEILSG